MSDEPALLAAIGAEPDDDIPRLVYADWLDEHGRADRAEFIRVQVEAGGLRWNDRRWSKLSTRAGQLLKQHWEQWIEPLGWFTPGQAVEVYTDEPTADGLGGGVQLSWVDPHPGDMGDYSPPYERCIDFHRGFPRQLWLEPEALAAIPGEPAVTTPRPRVSLKWAWRVERNWVKEVWPTVSRALRAERFSGWEFTTFNYEFGWLRPLAADSDVARGMRGLLLEGGDVAADGDIINLYPRMLSLEDLMLSYGLWSPAVIRELGRVGLSGRLRRLMYYNNQSNTGARYSAADAIRALAGAGEWPQLVSLTLDGLDGVGANVLDVIRASTFPSLKRMAFSGPGGTEGFFAGLLGSPHLAHVERIEYRAYGTRQERSRPLERLSEQSGGRFVYK